MRYFVIFFVILIIYGCNAAEKKLVQKEIVPVSETKLEDYGPFFLPENRNFQSVSIHYLTKEAVPTSVYFSMVGDVDWVRTEPGKTRYHTMVFDGLEESAIYHFSVPNASQDLKTGGMIRTVPYGDDFTFSFGVASISADGNPYEKSIEKDNPNFLVLLSPSTSLSEKDFVRFYQSNKKLIGSTILVPLFDWEIGSEKLTLAQNGFYYARYKNVNIIGVYKELPDYDCIIHYLSDDPNDRNYIFIGNIGVKAVNEISKRFSALVNRIYAYPVNTLASENISSVKDYETVQIVKKTKAKYVFK